mgnify:CR=1 FL=1
MTTTKLAKDILNFIISILFVIVYTFILSALWKILPIFKWKILDYISLLIIYSIIYHNLNKIRKKLTN